MIRREKSEVIETPVDCLSLFDEQFTITELSDALNTAQSESNSIIKSVKEIVENKQGVNNNKDDYNFVVDMDNDLKKSIDSGKIKLVTNKNGDVFAQKRRSDGKFGEKLPIKKELKDKGISMRELQMALQLDMIKDQLGQMIDTMKRIESRVVQVIKGQQNDRIGLYYSGLSLYAEAQQMNDETLKKYLLSQALKSLSDANSQMIQEARTSIEYLVNRRYKKEKKALEIIDEHLTTIRQCCDVIHRSSFLKAVIYQQSQETVAMLTCMNEYSRFVEKMIAPYAMKLNELDSNGTFFNKSTWGQIVNTLKNCDKMKARIANNDIYYLD